MKRTQSLACLGPAAIEGTLVVVLAAIALVTTQAGLRLGCTALVEFGILSAISAASALILCTRYIGMIRGGIRDHAAAQQWLRRLRLAAYVGFAGYAIANAALDLAVPRREIDPVSYPGFAGAAFGVLVVALVLEMKYRMLQIEPLRSLFESLADDAFFVVVGLITLAGLIGHIVYPSWWLDTTIDIVLGFLVALRVRGFMRRPLPVGRVSATP